MTSVPEKDVCSLCGARRIDQQLGLEATPEEYLARMVAVFREVRRVLRSDGTCWVNMGDSYAQQGGQLRGEEETQEKAIARQARAGTSTGQHGGWEGRASRAANTAHSGLKPKDLCMMPHRLAIALQADGWWVRSDIVWHKPNPLPESVTDRPTKSHEYVFLLTKSARYHYDADAVREPNSSNTGGMAFYAKKGQPMPPGPRAAVNQEEKETASPRLCAEGPCDNKVPEMRGRNLRSVWTIPTQSFPEAHFATFPEKLVLPCLRAGTSEKGACPECGAAWRRVVEKGELAKQPGARMDKWDRGKLDSNAGAQAGKAAGLREAGFTPNHSYEHHTVGWEPGCECWGQLKACGADANGEYHGQAQKDYDSASAQNPSDTKRRILEGMKKRAGQTWHWEPGCECLVGPLVKWLRAGALWLPKWAQEGLHHWLAAQYDMPTEPCVVLDPFCGSGTTLLVAEKMGLDSIGIELNADYVAIAEKRLGAQGRLEL